MHLQTQSPLFTTIDMSKEKFLTVSVVFLLVLNAGIVGYLMLNRQAGPPELWRLVIAEVGFDDQQQSQYLALRDEHRMHMNRLDGRFADVLIQYLNQLKASPDSVLESILTQELANIEKQKAEVTLQHFRSVRTLCRPEQTASFDRLVPKLMLVLLPPKKELPPRRK
jgi:hypothetical protein